MRLDNQFSHFSVDMLAHAIDNAAPSTIVLISGDRDFAYALSILRFRRYRIVLITHSNAHQSLRAQASTSFDWVSEVLEPVDPALSNQPTSPRRGKISSPPAHDKFHPDSMGHNRHNPSSSLFQESYDEKSANSVQFMNSFQDETCTEIQVPRTPCKHDAKHDSLPPYLERQLAASSMGLNNGPETPTRAVHSPVGSCHTYPNGSMQTPLTTTACSSESNLSSRISLNQARLSQALQESRHMPAEASCRLDLLCGNQQLNHESSPITHQPGSPSPINATQPLSSVDRMVVDDNHPGSLLGQSPAANVTAKVTTPTPTLIPPSSTLSSATLSATAQISSNRRQPTSSIAVPDKFKILIRCLKSHRSRGILSSLRSKISSEIAQNGTTYSQAGVSTFSEYVVMAEKAGIVELGGSESTGWIALKAPWYNARLSWFSAAGKHAAAQVHCNRSTEYRIFSLVVDWNFGILEFWTMLCRFV